jgi:hypothetical protein
MGMNEAKEYPDHFDKNFSLNGECPNNRPINNGYTQ